MTDDPSDVSEQCSVTKTALDDKVIDHQEKQEKGINKTKGQNILLLHFFKRVCD